MSMSTGPDFRELRIAYFTLSIQVKGGSHALLARKLILVSIIIC